MFSQSFLLLFFSLSIATALFCYVGDQVEKIQFHKQNCVLFGGHYTHCVVRRSTPNASVPILIAECSIDTPKEEKKCVPGSDGLEICSCKTDLCNRDWLPVNVKV
ncbi:hypothetical protein M3Y95_01071800 [Aphelenchoides besseyi]|nr:hypothetical protein M3Y95_01071800 [Aphelenchoides besseyi]